MSQEKDIVEIGNYREGSISRGSATSVELLQKSKWYKGFVRLFVWYPSDLPKQEKKLLVKLDFLILLYVCLSYFTKALDKSNIIYAYTAGMKEEIDFGGDDLAYAKSLYSAGYIVSMCFGVLFVTRPWARVMLPVLECTWGVLTFCQAAAKNRSQMFALRFLVGLAEGPIFPSVVYTIGSWYSRNEVFRRVMAFSVSSSAGGMFAGYLQNAAYKTLAGKGGLSSWKWGFIIDGIVTVPIALIGFAMYPGTCDQARGFWLIKDSEHDMAVERMRISGVRSAIGLRLSLIPKVFRRWHIHYYTAFWVLLNVVALPDGLGFNLWLKSKSPEVYSQSNVDNYPTIQGAVSIVAQFFLAGLSDTFPPWYFLTLTQLLFIISYSSLAAWDIPDGYRFFCFLLIGFTNVNQAIVSGQINRSVRRNAEQRAFVLGFSDAVSQAMNIWTNIVFYPTSHGPRFRLGYIISLVAAVIMLFLPIIPFYGDRYDDKKYAKEDELASLESLEESSKESA